MGWEIKNEDWDYFLDERLFSEKQMDEGRIDHTLKGLNIWTEGL